MIVLVDSHLWNCQRLAFQGLVLHVGVQLHVSDHYSKWDGVRGS